MYVIDMAILACESQCGTHGYRYGYTYSSILCTRVPVHVPVLQYAILQYTIPVLQYPVHTFLGLHERVYVHVYVHVHSTR